jgi:hypothetical protein
VVRKDARVMCWSRSRLSVFLAGRPDVALALERSVGLRVQHVLGAALSWTTRANVKLLLFFFAVAALYISGRNM